MAKDKATAQKGQKKQRSALKDVVTYDMTVNLHKRLFGTTFKDKAPKAIKEIKKFAAKRLNVSTVLVDPQLNKELWKRGVKNPPRRVRIRVSRKRNDDENAKEKLYAFVQAVNVDNVKGLQTVVVE